MQYEKVAAYSFANEMRAKTKAPQTKALTSEGPPKYAGLRIHEMVVARKYDLNTSYEKEMHDVLADPRNADLVQKFSQETQHGPNDTVRRFDGATWAGTALDERPRQ